MGNKAFVFAAIITIAASLICSSPAVAGPLENADEFMQSQINLQTGEETDAPPAEPVIEWADDSSGNGASEDTGSGSNAVNPGQSGQ